MSAKPVSPTFEEAWAEMEAKGYQYGPDALGHVRFGWDLRQRAVDTRVTHHAFQPFVARCGANAPNQHTAENTDVVTCVACLRAEIAALHARVDDTLLLVGAGSRE